MRLTSLVLVLGGVLALPQRSALAQEIVPLEEVRNRLHQRVTVEGKVAEVRRRTSGQVWLGLGRPYPTSSLVIILRQSIAQSISDLSAYRGRTVRVTGLVRPGVAEGGTAGGANRAGWSLAGPEVPNIELEERGMLERVDPPPGQ